MGTLGSGLTGMGNVQTAGEPPDSAGTPGPPGGVTTVTATVPAVVNNTDPANPVIQVSATPPPAVGPSSVGTSNDVARGNHSHPTIEVATLAALALVASATINAGTFAYVTTLRCWFKLEPAGSSVAAAAVRVAASGKAGFLWFREALSPAWWNQIAWFITSDALAGTNEGTGASIAQAISPQEYRRRHFARWLPGVETASVTLTLVADLGDNDYIQVYWSQGFRGGNTSITVNGAQTVVATGVITAATALNRAANQPNEITAGFAWAAHVGRMIRLQGTTTTTAHVLKDLGANAARLGEQSVAGATGTGFTAGQTIEVVTSTKMPGAHIIGANVAIFNDCDIDPAGATQLRMASDYDVFQFSRCKFRAGATSDVIGQTMSFTACSFVTRTWLMLGRVSCTLCSQVNQPVGASLGLVVTQGMNAENQFQSHVLQASTLFVGERTYMHVSGGGSANIGCFDLAATQIGIGGVQSSHVDVLGMWGAGNNATSIPLSIANQGAMFTRPPGTSTFTVTGGLGFQMLCGGVAFNVPLTQLPHAIGPGQQPGSSLKFTGFLSPTTPVAPFSYMADPGLPLAIANNQVECRYPTSERLALRLRVTKRSGAVLTNPATVTLYKNNAPTTMQITVNVVDPINTKYVDSLHPILFTDGDDLDVRIDEAADVAETGLLLSAQVEFAN